jgi:Mg-chelatase subunit ChlD
MVETNFNWFEEATAATESDDSTVAPRASSKVAKVDRPAALKLSAAPRHLVIGTECSLSKTQICATISARDLPEHENQRAAVDIIVALDVSDSMSGKKLALCKKSLDLLLHSLCPGDRFGLVSFSDEAVVEVPIHEYFVKHKEIALRHIKSLQTRYSTNVSAAIRLAAQEMRTISSPNPVRTIFLLTDGLANRGITLCCDLVKLTERHFLVKESSDTGTASETLGVAAQRFPLAVTTTLLEATKQQPKGSSITLHCFGYGSDHDSCALRSISQATPGGTYYFVEDDSNVLTAFGDALGGVFSVVAQNAVLHITIPAESEAFGVDILKVFHKNKIKREDKSYSVALGDFYAEESRDILFEVTLAKNPPEQWITHATVSLSYTDTLSKEQASCPPKPCDIARMKGRAISAANTHVKVQWLRIRVTKTIQKADRLSSHGNLEDARAVIDSITEAIHLSTEDVRCHPFVKQLIADLDRVKEGLVSRETYVRYGTHRMHNTIASHGSQRCMESGGMTQSNLYRGSLKAKTTRYFS